MLRGKRGQRYPPMARDFSNWIQEFCKAGVDNITPLGLVVLTLRRRSWIGGRGSLAETIPRRFSWAGLPNSWMKSQGYLFQGRIAYW